MQTEAELPGFLEGWQVILREKICYKSGCFFQPRSSGWRLINKGVPKREKQVGGLYRILSFLIGIMTLLGIRSYSFPPQLTKLEEIER